MIEKIEGVLVASNTPQKRYYTLNSASNITFHLICKKIRTNICLKFYSDANNCIRALLKEFTI